MTAVISSLEKPIALFTEHQAGFGWFKLDQSASKSNALVDKLTLQTHVAGELPRSQLSCPQ